jgi:hypothetical protein
MKATKLITALVVRAGPALSVVAQAKQEAYEEQAINRSDVC